MTNHHLTFFHLASCVCAPNRRAGQRGAACTYARTHTYALVHARDVAVDIHRTRPLPLPPLRSPLLPRIAGDRERRLTPGCKRRGTHAASCLACIGSRPSTGLLGKIGVTSNFKLRLIYSAYVPCTSMYPLDFNIARSDAIYGTDLQRGYTRRLSKKERKEKRNVRTSVARCFLTSGMCLDACLPTIKLITQVQS